VNWFLFGDTIKKNKLENIFLLFYCVMKNNLLIFYLKNIKIIKTRSKKKLKEI
jgi:hypothetical protein